MKTSLLVAGWLLSAASTGIGQEKPAHPSTPTPIDSVQMMIVHDLENLLQNAATYRRYPRSMGGGQGSFTSYTMPKSLSYRYYAEYTFVFSADSIEFTAVSKDGYGSISAKSGPDGKRSGPLVLTGTFLQQAANPTEP